MRKNRNSKMWEYIVSVGAENGTHEEIKSAKHAYRKAYFLTYKQRQRKVKPEHAVKFSKSNGEYERVKRAAKLHSMTITGFIQSAVLSYIGNTYIVPDKAQVARLEQLLSECLNEIKTIIRPREKYFWERERRLEAIEKRIEKLEVQINEVFRNPPMLHDRQNKTA